MARANDESSAHAPSEASVTAVESDDVQQSLELLDRVLLEFEDPCRAPEPPPPPEEAARLISAIMSSPRGSPGHSLQRRASPPEPGGGGFLPSSSQTSAGTQTTLPKVRHTGGTKKLSSKFGSLPFDLSSHAAPQPPPPWLVSRAGPPSDVINNAGVRSQLHLPIQNPLTSSLNNTVDSSESDAEQEFSDDSLEGQVSSSDREADFRDLGSTTSREELASSQNVTDGGDSEARQRGSIAWDIPLDWDLDEAAAASKKRRREESVKGASRSQPQTPSNPPPIPTSLSGGGTYVIRDRRKRPALEDAFLYVPVIPLSSTFTSGVGPQHQQQCPASGMTRGRSLPVLQTPYKPSSPRHVPEVPTAPVTLLINEPASPCQDDEVNKEETTLTISDTTIEPDSLQPMDAASDTASKCNNIIEPSPPVNAVKTSTDQEPSTENSEYVTELINSQKINDYKVLPIISTHKLEDEIMKPKEFPITNEISEMSFKIMRPKKIRPNSMPANEASIVVFKSTVQLETKKQKRPNSGPPNEIGVFKLEHLHNSQPEGSTVNSMSTFSSTDELQKPKINTPPIEIDTFPLTVTQSNQENCTIELNKKEKRPQSVFIPSVNQIVLTARPVSCSDLNFEDKNNMESKKAISEVSSVSVAVEIPETVDSFSFSSKEEEMGIRELEEKHETLPSESPEVPEILIDSKNNSTAVPNCSELAEPFSTEEELPPPPSALELESAEVLAEMADKVEIPVTVNSIVQTDITLGKRHKLSFDSPSEEQVVPSLGFRTSTLLTPDDPPVSKNLSLITFPSIALNKTDAALPISEGEVKVLEPETKCTGRDSENSNQSKDDDENELVTTVILETRDDDNDRSDDSVIKKPTELFTSRDSTVDSKLSRDSQRRKSHGSSLEMTSRDSEKRRSAPESNFLFPQGHYTIPLSFAITNKPPSKSQNSAILKHDTDSIIPSTPVEAVVVEKNTPIEAIVVEQSAPPVSTEPVYKSVKKKSAVNGVAKLNREKPPPLPPHQNLTPQEDDYAEPRNIPDFGSNNVKRTVSKVAPSRPRHLPSHKEQQPPPPPPHQTQLFEAEKPLPPTPLTPIQTPKLSIVEDFDTHPLPPSPKSPKPPRAIPMSATFPVPPSPSSLHRNAKSQHISPSPVGGRRRLTPPSPSLPRAPYPLPASPEDAECRLAPRRPLPSPPESDYGFTREPGTTGLGSLKTRSVDAGLGRGLREQIASSISQGREVGGDRMTLPMELSGATPRRHPAPPPHNTGLRQGKKKGRAPTVPPHASLPETPVFTRGCDIPRAPYRPPAVGIPVLRSSLSEEGDRLVLCGPARGWYPKQRQNKSARSTENLDQASSIWGEPRKPQTLPPNLNPPKFFHRSPREALRRVTSLLIRRGASSNKEPRSSKDTVSPNGASGSQCDTPQRQKRSFFRSFWKKSKHYSLEQ